MYATGYDNERKKQARRRQFMFGLRNNNDRYDFDAEVRTETSRSEGILILLAFSYL